MSYNVHNFQNGEVIEASPINEMDAQILLNSQNIEDVEEHITDIIDDTAGEGDTDKTWSADKLSQLEPDVPVEDVQIDGVSILENGTANITLAKLGAESGVVYVEEVTGTTITITGEANTRYMCGEAATLTITPPSSGTIDVIFTSGTTPTVLDVPSTVIFPEWVDTTALEASTIYEIIITDGVYGSVTSWPDRASV